MHDVAVIDVVAGSVRPAMTVIVTGPFITSVGPTAQTTIAPGTRIIDARGRYVIPGLWDMHAHSFYSDADPDWVFPLYIAHGVTGIRDMGTLVPIQRVRAIRDAVTAGRRIGPRVHIAGPLVDGFNTLWADPLGMPNAAEATRAVRLLHEQGADFVKLSSLMPRDAYFAALAEAGRLKLPVAGPIPEPIAASEASRAGQQSIEHLEKLVLACSDMEPSITRLRAKALARADALLELLDQAPQQAAQMLDRQNPVRCRALFIDLARRGTRVVPALIGEDATRASRHRHDDPRLQSIPPALRERWRAFDTALRLAPREMARLADAMETTMVSIVKELNTAQVAILAGTNAGPDAPYVYPGSSLHDELARLVDAGLSPAQALRAATINAARFLGQADRHGEIKAGRYADLVLLDANPLDQIGNVRRINGVGVNGRWLDRAALDALLEAQRAGLRD